MLGKNIEKLSSLIQKLCNKFPKNDLNEMIIFGSAAVTLHGRDLERKINDLDIFVSKSLFCELKSKHSLIEIEKSKGVKYLQTGIPKIELWKSFPGVTFDIVKKNAEVRDQSNGLLVASLEYLRIWKTTQGRTKDISDLKKME